MDPTASFISVWPLLAGGGGGLAVIVMAVWFARSASRTAGDLIQKADLRYNLQVAVADERLMREKAAHEATQKKYDDEQVRRRDAEERIWQLERDVRVLKQELTAVKKRLIELEGNGT